MISIIIPSYNRTAALEKCVVSIRRNSSFENEIIIMHPIEDPEIDRIVTEYHCRNVLDGSRVDGKRVLSLWGIINRGIDLSSNRYVCWLNDDCKVLKDWDRYASSYFLESRVGLVAMRSKGIGAASGFDVIESIPGVPCVNYGVLDKETGIRFDEKFSWFYGDADLPLQMIKYTKKNISVTSENCVVHSHLEDATRRENEKDPRAAMDEKIFKDKWGQYIYIPIVGLVRRNLCTRIIRKSFSLFN